MSNGGTNPSWINIHITSWHIIYDIGNHVGYDMRPNMDMDIGSNMRPNTFLLIHERVVANDIDIVYDIIPNQAKIHLLALQYEFFLRYSIGCRRFLRLYWYILMSGMISHLILVFHIGIYWYEACIYRCETWTMHTDIGYHMRMSGRTRHLLSLRSAQDVLANVLVLQQVQLHDPPATGSPCTAQEPTARPYRHFYTLHWAKYAALQPGWSWKMPNLRRGRDKHNTGIE